MPWRHGSGASRPRWAAAAKIPWQVRGNGNLALTKHELLVNDLAGVELGDDTKAVLLLAAAMFLWALLLGVWKYRQMIAAPDGLAHP